jgi:hypothetical protein
VIEKIRWLPTTILWRMTIQVQGSPVFAFAFPAHRAEGVIDDASGLFET